MKIEIDCQHTSKSIFDEVHLLPLPDNMDVRGNLNQVYTKSKVEILHGWADFRIEQQNVVKSQQGSIRGMHRTNNSYPTRKILSCLSGEITDVLLDTCKFSKSYGEKKIFNLAGSMPQILCIPSCVAHGFQTISKESMVMYLLDQEYDPASEININPFDPAILNSWTVPYTLSEKDRFSQYFTL